MTKNQVYNDDVLNIFRDIDGIGVFILLSSNPYGHKSIIPEGLWNAF